jgi:general secretion pathway protein E
MAVPDLDGGGTPRPIPYGFAKRFGVIVIGSAGAAVGVGLREGDDPRALVEVRRVVGRPLKVETVSRREFDQLLQATYATDGLSAEQVSDRLDEVGDLGALAEDIPAAEDLLDSQDDAPVIRLINGIIAESVRLGASDIHVEPYEAALVVRMRVDGVLREALRLPARVAPLVVSRIKVMARLDIAERRLPQDGRIGLTLGGRALDVRVSTLPSRHGERVVLRILDKEQAELGLQDLGMPGELYHMMQQALAEPNGIVLVTGPTGSGKTTTLYSCLRLLNDGTRNILTVEDPIEYAIDGVGQTQVNTKVGMTFASGLRAILRQDPDIVMVGEIRDAETAEIAVQASLTGHLVLSTVHTNDAVGAITRLKDLGVEPFLLASALRIVVAQRLVRQLCDECARPVVAAPAIVAALGLKPGSIVRQPVGCAACGNTGFRGRIGAFEAVRVDDTLRQLILSGADETAIARHAFQRSSAFARVPDLAASVRRLVSDGKTTVEEAIRIMRKDAGADAAL